MKKNFLYYLLIVAVVAACLLSRARVVNADIIPASFGTPAAGSWTWDDENVTGTIIPQYVLAPTYEADYALLQSEGIHLSGGARICHPYPGGQFGWNAQIRVLTNTGWQQVATVNEWVPDVEGKFMTCANVWSSGTYAIFGYWEEPAGWGIVDHSCADLDMPFGPEFDYVGPAATFSDFVREWPTYGVILEQRCANPEDFPGFTQPYPWALYVRGKLSYSGREYDYIANTPGYFCACENMYKLVAPPIIIDVQ